jgi:hypothetical protein
LAQASNQSAWSLLGWEREAQMSATVKQKSSPIDLMEETLSHSATPADFAPDWA